MDFGQRVKHGLSCKDKEEEAEFWQQHCSEDFAWEELSEPLENVMLLACGTSVRPVLRG